MFFCTRPCKARKPRNATLAASSLSTPGGSEAQIAGHEEKRVHLVLDDIQSRMLADIAAEQKKHVDAVAAFEKEGKEAEQAKEEMEAEKTKLQLASVALGIAQDAFDKAAERYKVQADEATDAEALATDGSWQTNVLALQSSINSMSELREVVENLSDEYVHSTASPAVDPVASDSAKKAADEAHKVKMKALELVTVAELERARKEKAAKDAEKAVNEAAQKVQDLTKEIADAEAVGGGDFLSLFGLGGSRMLDVAASKEQLDELKTSVVTLEANADKAKKELQAAEDAVAEAEEKLEKAEEAELEAKVQAQLIAVPTVGGAPTSTVPPEISTMAPSSTVPPEITALAPSPTTE